MERDELPADPQVLGDAQRVSLYGRNWSPDDPVFRQALARAHQAGDRPRCLCRPDGPKMYASLRASSRVERLPDSGRLHHPCCPSFEPGGACSGLGHLVGGAVRDAGADRVELRVGFARVRLQRRASQPCTAAHHVEVVNPGIRMSLRAVQHYLFKRAGIQLDTAVAGKRHQRTRRMAVPRWRW